MDDQVHKLNALRPGTAVINLVFISFTTCLRSCRGVPA
jgi:hypothetical protein